MGVTIAVPQILNGRGRFGSWQRLPIHAEISALGKGLGSFGYVLYDGTIAPQDTDRNIVSEFDDNSWLWGITASSLLTGGGGGLFTLEIADLGREELLQTGPMFGENVCGSGRFPFYFKHLLRLLPNTQLSVRVINRSPGPNSNQVQIVGWGLRK